MNVTRVSTPYFTDTGKRGRIIYGVVIHDTESDNLVAPTANGSWHYEVDRAGKLWQYIDEADVAWHVRACDEWWPPWLPEERPWPASAANCWTVGIELVSSARYRAQGMPYTQEQYRALHVLFTDLYRRLGRLPVVSHGSLQLDRTDPVQFVYAFAGLHWAADTNDGYRYYPLLEDTGEDEDVGLIEELNAQVAALRTEVGNLNGVNSELQRQVDALRQEMGGKDSAIGALSELNGQQGVTISNLQARITELEATRPEAAPRMAQRIHYDDGSSQEVAA